MSAAERSEIEPASAFASERSAMVRLSFGPFAVVHARSEWDKHDDRPRNPLGHRWSTTGRRG